MYVMRINDETGMIWVYALRYEVMQEEDSTLVMDYIFPAIPQLSTGILNMMLTAVTSVINTGKNKKRLDLWKRFEKAIRNEIVSRTEE